MAYVSISETSSADQYMSWCVLASSEIELSVAGALLEMINYKVVTNLGKAVLSTRHWQGVKPTYQTPTSQGLCFPSWVLSL